VAHCFVALAYGQPANGIAVEARLGDTLRAFLAQIGIGRSLNDAEQRLTIALAERRLRSLAPARGQAHGPGGGFMLARVADAFVELHGDVRAKQIGLDLDRALGAEEQLRTIYVGPELDAVLAHFSQVRQRKDLEAARVGQDRVRPSHEAMKSAET